MNRAQAGLYAAVLVLLLIASRMPEPAVPDGPSWLPDEMDAGMASCLEFASDIDGASSTGSWTAQGALRRLSGFSFLQDGDAFESALELDLESGTGSVLLGGTWAPFRSSARSMPCIDPEYALDLIDSLRDYDWDGASWHIENGMQAAVLELPWAKASRLAGGMSGGAGTAWLKVLLGDGVLRRAEVYGVSGSGSVLYASLSVTGWNMDGIPE